MTARGRLDLDVRLLRHFLAVAEELHFGRAATRLFIAQQALSRDVQRLESVVSVALFDRRVTLTAAGERLLPGPGRHRSTPGEPTRTCTASRSWPTTCGPGESPVLTLPDQPPVPGAVLRPLAHPGAVYPWHLTFRSGEQHRTGLRALLAAAASLATTEGWLTVAQGAWQPYGGPY